MQAHRYARHWWVVLLVVVIVGCGGGSGRPQASLATPTLVPCPTPEFADLTGQFSEECVRQFITWPFRLPSVTNYLAPVFMFNPKEPGQLTVRYISTRPGGANLLLEILPRGTHTFRGTDDITSPRGHVVHVGPTGGGFEGSWEDQAATYNLAIVGGADSAESRRVIAALADSVLDGVPFAVEGVMTAAPSSTPDAGTPIPRDALHAVTLMFSEPLRETGGAGERVAVVDPGVQVVYGPGGCQPDIDATGNVAVRGSDGSLSHVAPAYIPPQQAVSGANVVWSPATGTLNGERVVMTGRFLEQSAKVGFDSLGSPLVTLSMTGDGRQVFGSLSERLIGYPVAMFVDGVPERAPEGRLLAPTIASKITDSIQVTGLSLDEAKRLTALVSYGLAQ
jgi:hypothetical protein